MVYTMIMQDADSYLDMLHSLSDMGTAMRKVMTSVLTNPSVYTNQTESSSGDSKYEEYMNRSRVLYNCAINKMSVATFCTKDLEKSKCFISVKLELKDTTVAVTQRICCSGIFCRRISVGPKVQGSPPETQSLGRFRREVDTSNVSRRARLLDGPVPLSAKARLPPAQHAARPQLQGGVHACLCTPL